MNNISRLALLIILIIYMPNCQTTDKKQMKTYQETIANSLKTGNPIYLKCSNMKQDGIYFIKTETDQNGFFKIQSIGTDKDEYAQLRKIEQIISVKKNQVIELPIKYSRGTYLLKTFFSDFQNGIILLKPANKTQMTLLDESIMEGTITGINFSSGEILFKTKFKNYTLTGDKIFTLKDSGTEVKIILLDGSQRNGFLTHDDGDKVHLKTILGTEVFSRKNILKIEYKTTKD